MDDGITTLYNRNAKSLANAVIRLQFRIVPDKYSIIVT